MRTSDHDRGDNCPLSDGQSPVADYQVAYTLLNRRRSAPDSIRQRIEELPLTKITPSDEWAEFIIFTRISVGARFQPSANLSGGSSISGKGVHIYKGVRIAEFLSLFFNIP